MVKIAAMGDNVVDRYLARGEMHPGGNYLNVAVHASRFGAQSAYIGEIGRDGVGGLTYDAPTPEEVLGQAAEPPRRRADTTAR